MPQNSEPFKNHLTIFLLSYMPVCVKFLYRVNKSMAAFKIRENKQNVEIARVQLKR